MSVKENGGRLDKPQNTDTCIEITTYGLQNLPFLHFCNHGFQNFTALITCIS